MHILISKFIYLYIHMYTYLNSYPRFYVKDKSRPEAPAIKYDVAIGTSRLVTRPTAAVSAGFFLFFLFPFYFCCFFFNVACTALRIVTRPTAAVSAGIFLFFFSFFLLPFFMWPSAPRESSPARLPLCLLVFSFFLFFFFLFPFSFFLFFFDVAFGASRIVTCPIAAVSAAFSFFLPLPYMHDTTHPYE